MTDNTGDLDNQKPFLPSVDWELLTAILEPEDETYPWNLASDQVDAYFQKLAAPLYSDPLLMESLEQQGENFYNSLDQIWNQVYSYKADRDERPRTTLSDIFGTFVPSHYLDQIMEAAKKTFHDMEHSTIEKIVGCVQSLLPNWDMEDLLVLARPIAYSMRSGQQEKSDYNLPNRNWTELSEVERAKICLVVADYALKAISTQAAENGE
ncbi:MAG: hypothetical protein IV298_11190 [Cylindrospermopsis raciborskii KL1]|jgi:hypothetical protein|uniref:hypothetical protein n=1 Tax=Cylindrospermopsis raciborskii TaxID=77022 RepID=UPI001A1F02A9|nr:hypothetical protein [Cylindrospermopsis raciborskii]MBG0744032.1 hypothetical protein [Cylindrospermopsis raciborskii KL1]